MRVLASTALGILVMTPCLAQVPPAPPTPGMALVAQGKPAEALPSLEAELAKSPDDPKLGLARAQCLLDLARWNEALAAGQALLERFPGDADVRVMVGEALFASFRADEAVETWRPLMKDPRQAERALPRMLSALMARRKVGDARALAAKARTAGVLFNDLALNQAAQASACPEKLAFLEELARRHPSEDGPQEELRIQRRICEKGGTVETVTGALPARIDSAFLSGKKRAGMGFDSGSQSLFLCAPKGGKGLGLMELGRASFVGLGEKGTRNGKKVLLDKFESGGLRISNLPAILARAPDPFVFTGLGPFLDHVVEYDRRKGGWTLWPAGTSAETIFGAPPDVVLPVHWFRGIPLVPVSINGKGPYPFLFDTGATNTILAAQFCPLLGVAPTNGAYVRTHGYGKSGAFPVGYAEDVTLSAGGHDEKPPWVQLTEIPQRFAGPVYGFLGQDIVVDYRVVFDGPGCTISLLHYKGGVYRDPMQNRHPPNLTRPREEPLPRQPPPTLPPTKPPKGGGG